jgi:hypothetical protein
VIIMAIPVNRNHAQVTFYKSGVKAVAADIRRGNPEVSRGQAKAWATEDVASMSPVEVRTSGLKRLSRGGAKVVLAATLTAATVAFGSYELGQSPLYKQDKQGQERGGTPRAHDHEDSMIVAGDGSGSPLDQVTTEQTDPAVTSPSSEAHQKIDE